MNHKSIIILAGGASSRMKQSKTVEGLSEEEILSANTKSKALIGFGTEGRPILDYLLRNIKMAGYKHVYMVIGEGGQDFKNFYGRAQSENKFQGLHISYATQFIPKGRSKPLGTADAVLQALEQYPILQTECFSVCNSDNLYSVEALSAVRNSSDNNVMIAYDRDGLQFSLERIAKFALIQLNAQNVVLDIVEKPKTNEVHNYADADGKLRVSMNLFKLDGTEILPYLKNCPIHPIRKEKELPTAILNFIEQSKARLFSIPRNEHVPDITSKEDILKFKEYLKD